MAQQVGLAGQLPRPFAPLGELGDDLLPLGPDPLVPVERAGDGVTGELVEHGPLFGRAQQPQRLVLAVHGDERVGQLGQHPDGHRPAAEVSP